MMLTTTHKDLGVRFIQLSERCHQQINVNAELTWISDTDTECYSIIIVPSGILL
jgi:hypothetical protein